MKYFIHSNTLSAQEVKVRYKSALFNKYMASVILSLQALLFSSTKLKEGSQIVCFALGSAPV
jgi:hypothetical protein